MNTEINISDIKKISNNFQVSVNKLDSNIKRLLNKIDEINEFWQGKDATTYINAMKEFNIKELEKLKNILDDYAKYLAQVPSVYQNYDDVYRSKSVTI